MKVAALYLLGERSIFFCKKVSEGIKLLYYVTNSVICDTACLHLVSLIETESLRFIDSLHNSF